MASYSIGTFKISWTSINADGKIVDFKAEGIRAPTRINADEDGGCEITWDDGKHVLSISVGGDDLPNLSYSDEEDIAEAFNADEWDEHADEIGAFIRDHFAAEAVAAAVVVSDEERKAAEKRAFHAAQIAPAAAFLAKLRADLAATSDKKKKKDLTSRIAVFEQHVAYHTAGAALA
jgi:hypothetical protein